MVDRVVQGLGGTTLGIVGIGHYVSVAADVRDLCITVIEDGKVITHIELGRDRSSPDTAAAAENGTYAKILNTS